MTETTHEHMWEACTCGADVCHVEVCVWCELLRSTTTGETYDVEHVD